MRFGLALGGGGAKGLAHIPILETLDELGLRPHAIAGTSIGAVIGALYASGLSGAALRREVDGVFAERPFPSRRIFDLSGAFRQALDLIDLDLGSGGFVRGEKFMEFLYEDVRARSFEELETPLKVVATDFWSREEVVFDAGELLPAVRASMSLPVLFAPVSLGNRVLMDGGAVNPVPYDLLLDDCDVVVAVDVAGIRTRDAKTGLPSLSEAVFNTYQIMSKAILEEKLRHRPPHLILRPELVDVQVLEFDKAPEIFEAARWACGELRAKLPALLASG